jgi:hypothetical protein
MSLSSVFGFFFDFDLFRREEDVGSVTSPRVLGESCSVATAEAAAVVEAEFAETASAARMASSEGEASSIRCFVDSDAREESAGDDAAEPEGVLLGVERAASVLPVTAATPFVRGDAAVAAPAVEAARGLEMMAAFATSSSVCNDDTLRGEARIAEAAGDAAAEPAGVTRGESAEGLRARGEAAAAARGELACEADDARGDPSTGAANSGASKSKSDSTSP